MPGVASDRQLRPVAPWTVGCQHPSAQSVFPSEGTGASGYCDVALVAGSLPDFHGCWPRAGAPSSKQPRACVPFCGSVVSASPAQDPPGRIACSKCARH
jgi:hypothetical protein